MNRLNEIRARLAEIQGELLPLADADTLDEAGEARFSELTTEWDALTEEAKPLEERFAKTEEIRKVTVANPATRTPGTPDVHRTDEPDNIYDLRSLDRNPATYGTEVRDRACRAIEEAPEFVSSEGRAAAERLVRMPGRSGEAIAQRILATGSPDYLRAFEKILANPTSAMLSMDAAEQEAVRAALSLTDANGGFLVPFTLDPTIILTNDGAINPFRQIARQVSITTDEWHGVSSAGVTAEWLAEASEVTDASPTFAQPTIPVHKAAAWIQASIEVTQDSGIAAELGALFADAKDRLEADAFVTGTGSDQPTGIVTALNLTTASRLDVTTNGAYGAIDVYALAAALPPRYRANASWLGELSIFNLTRQFAGGTGPQHAFWADLGMNTPSLLLGKPIYESSAMASSLSSATASTDEILILGDFRNYVVVDRVGMSVVYEPLVKGANRRPTGEVGWFAYWRVGGDSVNDAAFRMLVA